MATLRQIRDQVIQQRQLDLSFENSFNELLKDEIDNLDNSIESENDINLLQIHTQRFLDVAVEKSRGIVNQLERDNLALLRDLFPFVRFEENIDAGQFFQVVFESSLKTYLRELVTETKRERLELSFNQRRRFRGGGGGARYTSSRTSKEGRAKMVKDKSDVRYSLDEIVNQEVAARLRSLGVNSLEELAESQLEEEIALALAAQQTKQNRLRHKLHNRQGRLRKQTAKSFYLVSDEEQLFNYEDY